MVETATIMSEFADSGGGSIRFLKMASCTSHQQMYDVRCSALASGRSIVDQPWSCGERSPNQGRRGP